MTTNLSYNLVQLFEEVVSMGREQGAFTQEAYNDIVDVVIEQHREWGEIHDDDPTEDMREQLRGRWEEYREAVAE